MIPKCLILTERDAAILIAYLFAHKSDIEGGQNDFGDLKPLLNLLQITQ